MDPVGTGVNIALETPTCMFSPARYLSMNAITILPGRVFATTTHLEQLYVKKMQ